MEQMHERKKIDLTPEELDEIRSLPVRSALVGGTPVKGYFKKDEGREGGLLYIVNDHWEIVKVVRQIQRPAEEDADPEQGEKEEGSGTGAGRTGRSGRILLYALLLLLAAAGAALIFFLPRLTASGTAVTPTPVPTITPTPASTPSPSPVPSPEPTATPEPPTLSEMSAARVTDHDETIVIATENIHKGDRVTEDMVDSVTVSAGQYNDLILSGVVPAKWEYLDTLLDMYVNRFIPAGQYMAVTSFSTLDPVPGNPWAVIPGGYVTAEIPVSDLVSGDIPYYGAKGTLTLIKETGTMTTPVPSPEPAPEYEGEAETAAPDPAYDEYGNRLEDLYETPEPTMTPAPVDGLVYEASVSHSMLVDSYTITDVVVTDLLNGDGESIYDVYSHLMDMPELYRRAEFLELCADTEYLESVTPVTLVIRLSGEQANAVGNLDNYARTFDILSSAADGDVQATIANGTMLIQQMVFDVRVTLLARALVEEGSTDESGPIGTTEPELEEKS